MNDLLKQKSIEIRKKIIKILHHVGGGHYGGSLSIVDILLVLYEYFLDMPARKNSNGLYDRLILSKGHAAIALYSVLSEFELIQESKLYEYGEFMSGLEGHPDMLETYGVDFSTGSLGQGISVGLGMALGLKSDMHNKPNHVWVIVGDGECQEGQIWEAAILAARYRVNNLHVILDYNNAQEYGYKYNNHIQQEPLPNLCEKWKAFGWDVQVADGHDRIQLKQIFSNNKLSIDKPSIVIASTKKGKGVTLFEEQPEYYHCAVLSNEEYELALKEVEFYAK